MKKTIKTSGKYLSIIALLFCFQANAQKGEIGFRFMPTISDFSLQTSEGGVVESQATVGYGIGGLLAFNFTDNVGIQGEVIYNSVSQKYTENDVERRVKLKYVNIPLLLSLNTGRSNAINVNLVAGPQIGLSAGSNLYVEDGNNGQDSTTAVLAIKKGDLGFAYGGGLDFALNPEHTFRLGIGFRGVFGLLDISDNSATTETNSYYILDKTRIRTYSAYAGLSFLF